MSLSSLFNLPSAPAQLLADSASVAQNSPNAPAPQGDAFATYMAQQMSSGQFANWQNLTNALANQNALGSTSLGNGLLSNDPTAGFGPSQDLANTGSSGADSSTNNDSSTSQANSAQSNYAAHRRLSQLNKDQTLLGDSIDATDSADSSSSDANGTSSNKDSSIANAVSTNTWLLNASAAREGNPSSNAGGGAGATNSTSASTSANGNSAKNAGSPGTPGSLPIVLPSIGAALQAQQNALKAQGSSTLTGGKDGSTGLKTTSLSDKVQLITPNQTDTNPQSLVSYARGMGLNDSQIHQLFGTDAANGNSSGSSNPASTAAIIGSGANAGSSTANGTLSTHSTLDSGLNAPQSLSTSADSTSLLSGAGGVDQTTGSLSATANSVLDQVSNLQVQIDQAPGATGIQNEATASTLAELNSKVGNAGNAASVSGLTGMTAGVNKNTTASTLEVLSVMDASLRPEDVQALQAHFESTERSSGAFGTAKETSGFSIDMNTGLAPLGAEGSASSAGLNGGGDNLGSGFNGGANGESNSQQNNANVPADMAGAYEKLSNKFANEVSTRLQQQFAQGQWKMKFALRPTSLGVVDIQLEMKDGKLAANFQSNNPLTQNLIQTNSHQLRNALQGSGISESSVQVGSGQTNGQGSNSGQNSGVPYTYQSNPLNNQATATEEIPPTDDSTITKSSNSDSQLDIFA